MPSCFVRLMSSWLVPLALGCAGTAGDPPAPGEAPRSSPGSGGASASDGPLGAAKATNAGDASPRPWAEDAGQAAASSEGGAWPAVDARPSDALDVAAPAASLPKPTTCLQKGATVEPSRLSAAFATSCAGS
jgi:hypothetical protein